MRHSLATPPKLLSTCGMNNQSELWRASRCCFYSTPPSHIARWTWASSEKQVKYQGAATTKIHAGVRFAVRCVQT